jgi:hypothetical protein
VPDARIDDIRRRERDGAVELRRLRVGARVRIRGGPFRDHLGLCTAMTGRERVLVLLNVLGARRQVRRRAFAPDRKSSLSIRCSDRHRASGGVCF